MSDAEDLSPDEMLQTAARKLAEVRNRPCVIFRGWIDPSRCLQLHRTLDELEDEPEAIDLVVHSGGGDPHAAYMLTRRLRRQFSHVTAFVPVWAKSAATMVCLGCDELVLGEWGELGPLDTQKAEAREGEGRSYRSALERFKALESIRLYSLESLTLAARFFRSVYQFTDVDAVELGLKFAAIVSEPLYERIDPLRVGESHRALEIAEQYARRLLERYRDVSQADVNELVHALVRGYPAHEFVIDREELADLGLPARAPSTEEASLIWTMALSLIQTSHENICAVFPAGGGTEDTTVLEDEELTGPEVEGDGIDNQTPTGADPAYDEDNLTPPGH